MSTPVRIYVLHHPASKLAADLTQRIYHWFRMPDQRNRGIPVYLRSWSTGGELHKKVPERPKGRTECLEYLIPLVDAHMVRDSAWHDYLVDLSQDCLSEAGGQKKGWVLLPVALDPSAFNLPAGVVEKNFIRMPGAARGDVPMTDESAAESLLTDLTEALARDLNGRVFPKQRGAPLKIFISYARADTAEVPRLMRDHILGKTQCDAFLDENDIGFGMKYESVLSRATEDEARAFIVVAGDHYADRPVCRWEISQFSKPDEVHAGAKNDPARIQVFHPMMMLSTMKGSQVTRVLPELGQVPCLRWEAGRERLCFSLLMREVLLGARNVLEARLLHAAGRLSRGVIVNRLPGPVLLQRALNHARPSLRDGKIAVHYPGNGLPQVELKVMQEYLPSNVRLSSFRDIDHAPPDIVKMKLSDGVLPLRNKVIALSYSDSEELASLGYLPQHLHEAFVYLLRPLVRLGADVMYGGWPPREDKKAPLRQEQNLSITLLNLYLDEVTTKKRGMKPPRIFHPSPWPDCDGISAEDEAAWINHSSIHRVRPSKEELAKALPGTHARLALRAVVLSRARDLIAKGYHCAVPKEPKRWVRPSAVVLLGGKSKGYSGFMPGLIEEFACHFRQKRPIYLLGGFGGAAGIIARSLLLRAGQPQELTMEWLQERRDDHAAVVNGCEALGLPEKERPEARFNMVLDALSKARGLSLEKALRNGLTDEENKDLLTTDDTSQAMYLVWEGMSRILM